MRHDIMRHDRHPYKQWAMLDLLLRSSEKRVTPISQLSKQTTRRVAVFG